ncbi:VCBS domain-containing protein, partial [Vibrio breoganii]
GAHDTLTEKVVVTSQDGSATQEIVVTVQGVNDVPKITGTATGSVSEDATNPTLTVSGALIIKDVDANEGFFKAGTLHSAHGSVVLDADGHWTFTANNQNPDIQALAQGATLTEVVTVTSKDGTAHQDITITITGTNDAPVVTFTDNGGDHTHGSLSNTDVDTTDTHTYAVTGGTVSGTTQTFTGQFGDLVLDTATGKYTYIQHQSVAGMSIDNQGVYHGKEFFEVSTSDNHGGTSTKYLTFEPSMLVSAPAKDGDPAVLTPKLNQVPQLLDNQPNIPKITPPDNKLDELHIDPTTDTGSSHTDGITNIDTPTITGHSGVPFSVISLVDNNGNEVAKTTSNKDGDFSVTLSQLSGSVSGELHSITGHAMAPSSTHAVDTPTPLQLTIDTDIDTPIVSLTDGSKGTTTNPNTVISATELTHVDISGEIDHSGVTTELTGLTVTDTNGNIATLDPTLVTLDPTTGKFTLTGVDLSSYSFVDGQLTVHATATDLAGNSKTGTSIAQLDTNPGTISIDTTLGSDNVINAKETQSPLTISGTTTEIEAGQQVTIEFNGQQYHAIVQPDHTWTTDVPVVDLAKLPDGTTPTITATVTDLAGNEAKPATHDLTIDTSIDQTTVKLVDGGAGANFDGVINHNEQTHAVITGTIDPTAMLTVLTVTDGTHTIDVPLNSVMVGANGDFTANGVDLSSLTDGQLTVTATAVDPAGNESTNTGNTLMDTTPPAQLGLQLTTDTGSSSSDLITSNGQLTITGQETGAHTLYSVDGGHTWTNSFTPIEGSNSVSVKQVDPAGNESKPTGLTFTLDTKVAAPQVALKTDTGSSNTDHITQHGELEVTGTESGAHIEYSIDGGKTWVDNLGQQVDGQYTALVRQTDVAGNVSGSTTINYTIDTDTQIDVDIKDTSPTAAASFNQDNFLNKVEIDTNLNQISGHLDSDGELTALVISDTHGGKVTLDLTHVNLHSDGSFDISGIDLSSLAEGELTVTATSVDTAGNHATETATIYKDTQNTATDVTNAVKEETKTTVSGHVNLEADAHGVQSTIVTGSLSGDISGTYGTMHLNRDGSYTYDLDNTNGKVQALAEGVQITDTLTYTTIDPAGNSKESHLVVTITGTNDAAVIGGVTTGAVIEDKTPDAHHQLAVSGTLTISDIDTNTNISGGEEQFKVDPSSITHGKNTWGHLTIDKDGKWDYQVDNQGKVQHLQEGKTHTDTFTVHSVDGAAQDITVVITGTKDAPVITGGAQSGSAIEAGSTAAGSTIHGHATAQGSFSSADLDHLPTSDSATWSIVASATGNQQQTDDTHVQGIYGHLEINQNGDWKYVLNNTDPDTQALTAGQKVSETFNVRVTDSTSLTDEQTVTVNITGSNDQAKITGTDIGTVTEDKDLQGGNLHTTGTLSVTDVDSGEAHFTAETLPGTYGNLVMQENGTWTYTADNSQHVIQELKATDSLPDTFTITSADGTKHKVAVTINGTNDLPTIDHVHDTGAVTEDGSHADKNHNASQVIGTPTASGTLVANEVDKGDPAHWAVAHGQGTYGSLSIDSKTGHWTYTLDNSLNSAADTLAAGDHKTETFTVTDTDSSGQAVTHEIKITVNGSNDVPVISGTSKGLVVEHGDQYHSGYHNPIATATGTLTKADPDSGDTVKWSVQDGHNIRATQHVGTYGTLAIDKHGKWTYTIDESKADSLSINQHPKDTFTVLATDSKGQSIAHKVVVNVHGSNDNPVLSAYTQHFLDEDHAKQVFTITGMTDADHGDTHSYATTNNDAWVSIDSNTGAVTINPAHQHFQHLSVGESEKVSVPVTVKDNNGGSDTQTLDVIVHGTNDAPQITSVDVTSLQHRVDAIDPTSGMATGTSTDTAENSVVIGSHKVSESLALKEDRIIEGDIMFKGVDDHKDTSHPHGDTYTFAATAEIVQGQTRTAHTLSEIGFSVDDAGHFTFDAHADIYQHLQKGHSEHVYVTVVVEDNHHAKDTQTLHFIVLGENDGPTATKVTPLDVNEDNELKFTLGHDNPSWGESLVSIVDPESDKMDISNPAVDSKYGTLVDHGMGRFTFTPAQDQNYVTFGRVPITFDVDDNHGGTVTRTGYVHVNPVNDAPVANDVTLPDATEDATAIHITRAQLLANTHDVDNTSPELVLGHVHLKDPNSGTLTGDAQTGFTFVPKPDWNSNWNQHDNNHEIAVSFTVTDPDGLSNSAEATLHVISVKDPSIITDGKSSDTHVTDGTDIHASGKLDIVDPDLGDDSFKVTSTLAGQYGFMRIGHSGDWTYTLNSKSPEVLKLGEGETATDTLTVHGHDGTPHDIVITITGKNEAPTVTQVNTVYATESNTSSHRHPSVIIHDQLHVIDTDTSDTLTYSLKSAVPGFTLGKDGAFSFDPSHPSYNYLAQGQVEDLQVVVLISDGHTTTEDTVTIKLTGTNDAPIAAQIKLPSVEAGHSLDFKDDDLLAGTSDPDTGDTVHIQELTATHTQSHATGTLSEVRLHDSNLGSLTQNGKGGYTFTPKVGVTGNVRVDYKITDGMTSVDQHTTIHVTAAPASSSSTTTGSSSGTTGTAGGSSNPPKITLLDDTTHHIDENGATVSGQLQESHSDKPGTLFDAHLNGMNHLNGKYGFLSMTSDGKWTYHLNPHTGDTDPVNQLAIGDSLTDTLTVSGSNGDATITITIDGSNDKPVISGATQQVFNTQTGATDPNAKPVAVVDGTEIHGSVTATDVDHGDTLTFSTAHSVDGFVLHSDGSYEFKPDSSHYGHIAPGTTQEVTIPITVTDNNGETDVQNIKLTVQGQNRAPDIAHSVVSLPSHKEDFGTVTLDTQYLLKQAGATDPDGDDLHIINFKVTDNHGKVVAIHDNGKGGFEFTSAQDLNGKVHLSFDITDGIAAAQTVTATMQVTPVNDKPVAHNFDLASIAESTTATPTASHVFTEQDFLDNVTDPDIKTNADVLHLVGTPTLIGKDAQSGKIEAHGHSWCFVPTDPNFNGKVQVSYEVKDSHNQHSTATATIEVTATNDPAKITNPSPGHAKEDTTVTAEGTLAITDVDGSNEEQFHASSHIAGTYGYLEIDSDGNWKYVLTRGDKEGVQEISEGGKYIEHFPVTSKDGTHYSVAVEILGTNDNPVLRTINADKGTEGSSVVTGTITATDIDAKNPTTDSPADVLTYTTTYTHPGFDLDTATGTYTLNMKDSSFEHLAQGQTETLTIPVTVHDNHGGTSAVKNLVITVTGTNDVPVLDAVKQVDKHEDDKAVSGQLTSHDVDSDNLNGQHTTYHIQGNAVKGFALNADGSYTFNPHAYNSLQANENKDVEVSVIARDNHGDSAVEKLVFHITGTNDSATITGTSKASVTDSAHVSTTTVTAKHQLTVKDPDHDQNSFAVNGHVAPHQVSAAHGLQQTAYGHLSITKDGHWQYHVDHPDAVKAIPDRQHVTETFVVQSIDGTDHQVTITLNGKNEAATFSGDISGKFSDTHATTTVSGTLSVHDVDHGQDGLAVAVSNINPTTTTTDTQGVDANHHHYGQLDINDHGQWTYHITNTHRMHAIPQGATVTETFTLHAADGTPQHITITLTGTNQAPTVSGAVALANATEDTAITFNRGQLIANASDVDTGDTLHIGNPTVDASEGTVALDSKGGIVFTPAHDFNGDVTLHYDVVDSNGVETPTSATLTVDPSNDAPVAHAAPALAGIDEDVHKMFSSSDLLKGATDVDHDSLVVLNNSVTAEHGKVTYDANTHKFTYQPNSNYHGKETLHYKISDGHGGIADQTATFDIASVNDAPSISKPVSLTAHQEDQPVTLTEQQLLANAHDDDHDTLHVTGLTVDYGSITHNHDGTWSFKPQANYNGPVVFSYQVADGHGGTTDTTASMTVTADNDAAVIKLESGVMLPTTGQHPTTAGRLLITDVDGHAQEQFKAATGLPGTYGKFDMLTDGQFKYTLTNQHNPTIHNLVAGQSVTDSVTVRSADGTPFTVDVTIYGHDNHAPTVSQGAPIVMLATEQHQFSLSDFSFQDADMDTLDHITITDLPSQGELTFDGKPVTANQEIDAADIDKLVFTSHQGDHDNVIFHVAASDGHVDSAVTNVTMHVNPTPALVNAIPTPIGQTPQVIGSSDEPDTAIVDQAPIITLQDLAAATPASSGAQAYLAHLGIVQHNHDGPQSLDTPADLDLIFASSEVILDEHGAGVGSSTIMGDDTHDLEHQTHDDFNHHHDLLVEHHY